MSSDKVKFPDEEINDDESLYEIINKTEGYEFKHRIIRQTMMQTITKIDVGVESQLFVAPGSTSIIYFDVTNLRSEPTLQNFNVQDENRYLRAMEPTFMWLMPNQKQTVRVTVVVPTGTELGTKDRITFTANGVVQATQAVVITVATNGIVDSWTPWLWYTYSTRCDWVDNCVGQIWSIEVVARDYESGLLSIRSNPEGMILRAPFDAGTNDEVKATFSASCCEPRVTITAYDLNRNQKTIDLDVNAPWLSEYGIATVVLGVLFFILLITLIIILIVWCVKRKRKDNGLDGTIY
ncbi:CLUMA_CG004165, isoform A, partial [Clunio marinus]